MTVRVCGARVSRQTELNNLPPDSDDTGAASPFGPLTQRLVAALIEENIMTPPDEDSDLEKGTNKTVNFTTFSHTGHSLSRKVFN